MEGRRPPKVPEMLKDRGTHLVKLYEGCLSTDSAKRPSLEHVVQHFSLNLPPSSSLSLPNYCSMQSRVERSGSAYDSHGTGFWNTESAKNCAARSPSLAAV